MYLTISNTVKVHHHLHLVNVFLFTKYVLRQKNKIAIKTITLCFISGGSESWKQQQQGICIFIRIPRTFLETFNGNFSLLTQTKKKIAFAVSQNANVIFVCKRPSKRTRDFGRSDNFFSSSYMYLPIVMAASGVDRPSKYHNRHEVTNEAKNTDGR